MSTSLRDIGDLPDSAEDTESVIFDVKYLGETLVDVETANSNTTQAIGQAIKNVLSAKSYSRTRVDLSVSPKGIEIMDRTSMECLRQISIYRISNCSADVSNIFAFICSPSLKSPGTRSSDGFPGQQDDGPLTCHVFLCPKRKIAQSIALTVSKSFERAFDIWQKSEVTKDKRLDDVKIEERIDEQPDETVANLLIDLNADDLTDIRKSYLQNTWVSFDETEYNVSNLHMNAICS